jgi:hypothetical protein
MTLIPNWRDVMKHAWSVRFIILAVVLSALDALLPFVGLPIAPGPLAALSAVSGVMAGIARIVAQRRVSEPDWEDGK